MNLKTFLAEIRRYRRTFAAVAGSVFTIALVTLVLTPVKFVSTTQLMVSISGSTTAAAYQNDTVVAGRVNSYLELVTSDLISQRVVDKLHLTETAHHLASRVSATRVPPNTSIIDVAVTADSGAEAKRLADAFATEFISYTTALETPTGEDGQKVRVTAIGSASAPRDDIIERGVLVLLSALLAMVLGAAAVWIRAITDRVVRTADRAAAIAELPVLGDVSAREAVTTSDCDRYRRLHTRLDALPGGAGQVLQIVPVGEESDVTGTAINLATTLRLPEARTVVVTTAKPNDVGDVDLVAKPEWATDPDRILKADTAQFFAGLRTSYDRIIIATPPALSSPIASALSEYADGTLLAISSNVTGRSPLRRTAQELREGGTTLVGIVLVDREVEPTADGTAQPGAAELVSTADDP